MSDQSTLLHTLLLVVSALGVSLSSEFANNHEINASLRSRSLSREGGEALLPNVAVIL